MVHTLISVGLQYLGYLLETAVLGLLMWRGRGRQLSAPFVYLFCVAATDMLARPYMLYAYGAGSVPYAYFYWFSDVLLALAAFGLLCAFFRRACRTEAKLWGFLRLVLACVFILVLALSCFSLLRNYNHLFSVFIYEFGQNLYFTCLVLNTLLYLMLQQLDSNDEELGLLVCGMGIQFAGPAAALALGYLTDGQPYAQSLIRLILPCCTLGMLLTWAYALTQVPLSRQAPEQDALLAGAPSGKD